MKKEIPTIQDLISKLKENGHNELSERVEVAMDVFRNKAKKMSICNIEYASLIKSAELKEDWDLCINGRWYNRIMYCDSSDIGNIIKNINDDKIEMIEEVKHWNSENVGFDYIIATTENNEKEFYAIKVKEQ